MHARCHERLGYLQTPHARATLPRRVNGQLSLPPRLTPRPVSTACRNCEPIEPQFALDAHIGPHINSTLQTRFSGTGRPRKTPHLVLQSLLCGRRVGLCRISVGRRGWCGGPTKRPLPIPTLLNRIGEDSTECLPRPEISHADEVSTSLRMYERLEQKRQRPTFWALFLPLQNNPNNWNHNEKSRAT